MGVFAISLAFFLYRYNGYSRTRPRTNIMPSVKTSEDVESGIRQLRDDIDRLDKRARKEGEKIDKVKKKLDEYEKD